MPNDVIVYRKSYSKDSAIVTLARIEGTDGVDILQADLAAIYIVVKIDGVQTYSNGAATLTIASVIFDTLQNDGRWKEDTTGFNFEHTVPKEAFTSIGTCRVEYIFEDSSGNRWPLTYEGPVRSRATVPTA